MSAVKPSPIDCLIGLLCLVTGIGVAWNVYGAEDEPSKPDRSINSDSGDRATADGEIGSGEKPNPDEEQEREPIAVEDFVKFAQKYAEIDDETTRIEATVTWFESFGKGDFDILIDVLLSLYDGEGIEGLDEQSVELIEALDEIIFDDDEIVGSCFYESWAKSDPESLLAAMKNYPPEDAVGVATYALPFLWAENPAGASAAFDELRNKHREEFDSDFDSELFAFHLYQVAELEAVRWMIKNSPDDDVWLDDLFETGITDARGIFQEVLAIENQDAREDALGGFFENFAPTDPDTMRQLAAEFGPELEEEIRDELIAETELLWVLDDPAGRIDLESELYEPEDVIEEWLLNDHQSLQAFVGQLQEQERAGLEATISLHVARNFSELPFDFAIANLGSGSSIANLESQPVSFYNPPFTPQSSSWQSALTDEQLAQLAQINPEMAAAELYLRDPESAVESLQGNTWNTTLQIFALHAEGDPERQRLVGLLPESSDVTETFFKNWAQDDPIAAFTASADFPRAPAAAVAQWVEYEDPKKIYAAVGERFAGDEDIQNSILESWVKHDPQAAGQALITNGHESALPTLIEHWIRRDSVAASDFIRENLEPGATRDAAALVLADSIATRDAEAAREWAESITDQTARDELLKKIDQMNQAP